MSTGCECQFLQIEPEKWFYILEDYNAPKNAWDWREHASAYGPFPDLEKAEAHLDDNHANPGGSSISPLPDGVPKRDLDADPVLKALIDRAEAPRRESARFGVYSRG